MESFYSSGKNHLPLFVDCKKIRREQMCPECTYNSQWRIQDFLKGHQPLRGECQPIIWPIFSEKLHENEDSQPARPSRSANAIFLHYYKILPRPGCHHLVRVFPGAPGYVVLSLFVWLHLISLVTVDGLGDTQCLLFTTIF